MSSLTDQAEAVLAQFGTVNNLTPAADDDKSKHGRRLTRAEQAAILSLNRAGHPVSAIAETIKCSDQTVYNVLNEFQDTRQLARKRLKAGSLELAERIVEKANPKVALRVLEDLRVLTPPEQGGVGQQVNVLVLGGGSVPTDLPVTQALSPMSEALTVTAIPVSAAQREAKGAEKPKD